MGYPFIGKRWCILPVYLIGGLALGLTDHQCGQLVHQLGLKPGLATAVSVNFLMPLLAVGLAAVYPRLVNACLGAIAMTVAFILGLAFGSLDIGQWNPAAVLHSVKPVMVLACAGYVVLGTLTVSVLRGLCRWKGHEMHPPAG
jgi:hypothetical protein